MAYNRKRNQSSKGAYRGTGSAPGRSGQYTASGVTLTGTSSGNAGQKDIVHLVGPGSYYTATTKTGIRKMKTRTILFKNLQRLGQSDPKSLDFAQPIHERQHMFGAQRMGYIEDAFSREGESKFTPEGQLDEATRDHIKKMQILFQSAGDTVRQNEMQAAAGMRRDQFEPKMLELFKQPSGMIYDVIRFSADEACTQTPPVQQSDAWYVKNGYRILNTNKGLAISAPQISHPSSDEKIFLPFVVGTFGINKNIKMEISNHQTDALNSELKEMGGTGNTIRQATLEEVFMKKGSPQYKRLREQLGDTIHVGLPYYRNHTEQAANIVTHDELQLYAERQTPRIDIDSVSADAYAQYVAEIRREAAALDDFAASKNQPQGKWVFRGRNLYAVDLKQWVYLIIPRIMVRTKGMMATQTCTLKRTQQWYRQADVIFHDALRLVKSGYMTLTNMPSDISVAQVLEQDSADFKRIDGIVIRVSTGLQIYPKMNRYVRNNIIMGLEYKAFRQLVIQNPLMGYALSSFGIMDIDDSTLRQRVQEAVPNKMEFLDPLLQPFSLAKSEFWKRTWEERKTIEQQQLYYIDRKSQGKVHDRMNAWFKALNLANRQLVVHYKKGQLGLNTDLYSKYEPITPWNLVSHQLFALCVFTGTATDSRDNLSPNTLNGISYTGFTPYVSSQFELAYEKFVPLRADSTVSPGGKDLAQMMLSMLWSSAKAYPEPLKRNVSADGHDFMSHFKRDSKNMLPQNTYQQAFVAGCYNVLLEMQETFLAMVMSYQQFDYRGISDIQFFTFLQLTGNAYYEMTAAMGEALTQMIYNQTVNMRKNQTSNPVSTSRGIPTLVPTIGASNADSPLGQAWSNYSQSFLYMVQTIKNPRGQKIYSLSKFFNLFSDPIPGPSGLDTVQPVVVANTIRKLAAAQMLSSHDWTAEYTKFVGSARAAAANMQPPRGGSGPGGGGGAGGGGGGGAGGGPGGFAQPPDEDDEDDSNMKYGSPDPNYPQNFTDGGGGDRRFKSEAQQAQMQSTLGNENLNKVLFGGNNPMSVNIGSVDQKMRYQQPQVKQSPLGKRSESDQQIPGGGLTANQNQAFNSRKKKEEEKRRMTDVNSQNQTVQGNDPNVDLFQDNRLQKGARYELGNEFAQPPVPAQYASSLITDPAYIDSIAPTRQNASYQNEP